MFSYRLGTAFAMLCSVAALVPPLPCYVQIPPWYRLCHVMLSYHLGTANGFHWNHFALDHLGRIWNNTLTDPYQAGKFKLLREYKRKRCSKKTCFKQCGQVKFMGTMTKWPVQKHTEHNKTRSIQRRNRH